MDIQIFSDFHGEAYEDPNYIWKYVTPRAPVAIVAGDIDARKYEATVNEIATRFQHVVCLLGNHEFYKKNITWRPDKSLLAPNVHVLDRNVFELEDVIFIGATLWTDFNNMDWFVVHSAKDKINDFRIVRAENPQFPFTPHMANDLHIKDKQYIKMMLEKYRGRKVVVCTHFLPSYSLITERWKEAGGTLNYYFSASCDDIIDGCEIGTTWIFGHTHDVIETTAGNVRFFCNPIGYPRENPYYKDMVVNV